jgi:FkbM family methyltransferase
MNFLKRIFFLTSNRSVSQPLFEKLYRISLIGMNYGNGGNVEESGELYVMNYIRDRCGKEPLIFDVGSNEGQFATSILKTFGSNCRLFCFEPSIHPFRILTENLGNTPAVLNRFGFGEKDQTIILYRDPENTGLSSVYNRNLDHLGIKMNDKEEINLSTIDKYCAENNVDHIDFLKLDIEGHEFAALKGAKEMIANKKIRFIQFEFGGTDIDSRTFFQDFWYLLEPNYNIYRILKYGLHPLKKYQESLEIFTSINYLAELK